MNQGTLKLIAFAGIFLIAVGLVFHFSPLKTTLSEDKGIPESTELTISTTYSVGERIEGSFTVRFGNEQVQFGIQDPVGATVYDAGTATGGQSFALTAGREGIYTFLFDNTQENASKTVFFTLKRNAVSRLDLALVLIGIGLVVFGLVGFIGNKMKAKKLQQQQTPPPPS